jgi:hypothetical protein
VLQFYPATALQNLSAVDSQAGGGVQHAGDQRRVPALPLVAGDVPDRGAASLTGELRQPGLMQKMAAVRRDADRAHMLQPLE